MTVIGARCVVTGVLRRRFRSWYQHTPPPAARTTPRPAISRPVPSPLVVACLVIGVAGVAGLFLVVVCCEVGGATASCWEAAAVGVKCAAGEDEACSGEAEAEGEWELAVGEGEEVGRVG